jgi:hypothetical protein
MRRGIGARSAPGGQTEAAPAENHTRNLFSVRANGSTHAERIIVRGAPNCDIGQHLMLQ